MPTASTAKWPRPKSEDEWEDMVLDAMRLIWHDPTSQRNGCRGQKQWGVDVFGRSNGRQVGAQAKNMHQLSTKSLLAVIKEAEQFQPKLHELHFAIAGPRDARLQESVRVLNTNHGTKNGLEVHLWFYDDIAQLLANQPLLRRKYWNEFLPPSEEFLNQRIKLIDKPPSGLGHMGKLYLHAISEFNGRTVDAAVRHLLCSSSLFEFLSALGYELTIGLTRNEFIDKAASEVEPRSQVRENRLICNLGNGGMIIITDSLIWICEKGLEMLDAEYSYLKTI